MAFYSRRNLSCRAIAVSPLQTLRHLLQLGLQLLDFLYLQLGIYEPGSHVGNLCGGGPDLRFGRTVEHGRGQVG